MKAGAVETTRRHIKHLAAAAAVIALAVAFTLTDGVTTAQIPLELNFEYINAEVDEPAADEARTNFEVGVLLSAESQTAVTVDFHTGADTATPGQDYIDVATTLRFPPGVTRRTVDIPILGDDLGEIRERFRMRLSNPTGAQLGSGNQGLVTIVDDDANDTFRGWAEPRYNYVLESDGAVAVTVRLAGQYEYEIQMTLQSQFGATATVGQDYANFNQVFGFAPYETEKTIYINILDDRKKEAPEFIETKLRATSGSEVNLSGDDAFTRIWIGDDDHQKAIQSTTSDTAGRPAQAALPGRRGRHRQLPRLAHPAAHRARHRPAQPLRRPPGPHHHVGPLPHLRRRELVRALRRHHPGRPGRRQHRRVLVHPAGGGDRGPLLQGPHVRLRRGQRNG